MPTRFIARHLKRRSVPLTIRGKKLNAMVSKTYWERVIGLMHRGGMGTNECMLFVLPYSHRHGIWMRNMKFPIDVIWLDDRKRIVHIERSLPPCMSFNCKVYSPDKDSRYIVELQSGYTKRNRIKINDAAEFTL